MALPLYLSQDVAGYPEPVRRVYNDYRGLPDHLVNAGGREGVNEVNLDVLLEQDFSRGISGNIGDRTEAALMQRRPWYQPCIMKYLFLRRPIWTWFEILLVIRKQHVTSPTLLRED